MLCKKNFIIFSALNTMDCEHGKKINRRDLFLISNFYELQQLPIKKFDVSDQKCHDMNKYCRQRRKGPINFPKCSFNE